MKKQKSRFVIIELNDGSIGTTRTQYYLRGITNINFTLQNSIGKAQGLFSNIIHPWYLKITEITLQGQSYIGAYAVTDDEVIINPSVETRFIKRASDNISISSQRFTKPIYFSSDKSKEAQETEIKPQSSFVKYNKTNQLIRFMESLRRISNMVTKGNFRLMDASQIVQRLIISDYGNVTANKRTDLIFVGSIQSLKISEKSESLGVLDYTITFSGVPNSVAEINKYKLEAEQIRQSIENNKKPDKKIVETFSKVV